MNKIINWSNNNENKTKPYKKSNLTRLELGHPILSPMTKDDVKTLIKKMKKKKPQENLR